MTTATISSRRIDGFPQGLNIAQNAIHLPEVQAMLRRLSEYNLGIFMPHRHDELSGDFQPLPDDLIQVEAGLQVSFQPAATIAGQPDRYLPVGWCWRGGVSAPISACEMVREEHPGDAMRYGKHKMIGSN
jgi:hypothetical protein